jgi:hypothetical protein
MAAATATVAHHAALSSSLVSLSAYGGLILVRILDSRVCVVAEIERIDLREFFSVFFDLGEF